MTPIHPADTVEPPVAAHEMGAIWDEIRAVDWESTSLGPMSHWPSILRATLRSVLLSKYPICIWWGPEFRQFHNEAFGPMLGARAKGAIGAPMSALWREVLPDIEPLIRKALQGRGVRMEDMPLLVWRNGYAEETFWSFSCSPLFDDAGEVGGILNIVSETTHRLREREKLVSLNRELSESLARQEEGERQRRVLQRELSHRMKNTLAMVQAVVAQSLRHATSIEQASSVATARIQALGRAQDMLTATDWTVADMRSAVEAAIAPHVDKPNRFTLKGPMLDLSAQQAMGIALAIHELATNAAKYGALSNDEGQIHLRWALGKDTAFRFEWREERGPPVGPVTRKGFGTRLTERVVPGYFSGHATSEYRPEGFAYVMDGMLDLSVA